MIDPALKRVIGQMTYGVHVVAATHEGTTRAFTSTWTYQVSFAEPIVATSVSPKHDTYPLMEAAGWYVVSILAGDQLEQAQYFSYPGRRFGRAIDYFDPEARWPVVADCIGWMRVTVLDAVTVRDHVLFLGEVVEVGEGRLDAPALTYSSRKGWRIADTPARTPGTSVRDLIMAKLEGRAETAGGS